MQKKAPPLKKHQNSQTKSMHESMHGFRFPPKITPKQAILSTKKGYDFHHNPLVLLKYGGEAEIRTLDTGLSPYTHLAVEFNDMRTYSKFYLSHYIKGLRSSKSVSRIVSLVKSMHESMHEKVGWSCYKN